MPTKIARASFHTTRITGWENLHLEIVGSLELKEINLLSSDEVVDETSILVELDPVDVADELPHTTDGRLDLHSVGGHQ